MNVSLPTEQDRFVRDQVAAGRFRTASEVVREGLRLLEVTEHRRLLEKWIYGGLRPEEEEQLPREVKERTSSYFHDLVEQAVEDVNAGRIVDGPAAMERLREKLEARLQ